tara:strand:- start:343 stop:954 length:612 start_codon:yes stop_codon:yes gene_type:complete
MTNVTTVKNELRAELTALGVSIDMRWSAVSLKEKIAAKLAAMIETTRIHAEREAAKAADVAAREARIAQRGEFATFSERVGRDDGKAERQLSRVTSWAQREIDNHTKMSAKFAEEYAKNPLHAMSWSGEYFTHAAAYTVAMTVKSMFEGGVSVTDILGEAMREVMQKAKYPANSTSPTSNLCDTTVLATWTKVAEMLQGNSYW